jgi:hypothetical protein
MCLALRQQQINRHHFDPQPSNLEVQYSTSTDPGTVANDACPEVEKPRGQGLGGLKSPIGREMPR